MQKLKIPISIKISIVLLTRLNILTNIILYHDHSYHPFNPYSSLVQLSFIIYPS